MADPDDFPQITESSDKAKAWKGSGCVCQAGIRDFQGWAQSSLITATNTSLPALGPLPAPSLLCPSWFAALHPRDVPGFGSRIPAHVPAGEGQVGSNSFLRE